MSLTRADPSESGQFSALTPTLYLQQPGLEFVVQQDVKAQDFKAGAVESVVGEAGVVVMLDDGVGGDDRLDDDVLDISPDLLQVVAMGLHVRVEGGELPGRQAQAMRQGSRPLVTQGRLVLDARNCWRS